MNIYDNDNGKMYKFTDWCGNLYWFDGYNYNAEAQDYTDCFGDVPLTRDEVLKMKYGRILIEWAKHAKECLDAMTELTKLLRSEWEDGFKAAWEAAIDIMEGCDEWDDFFEDVQEMIFDGSIALDFVDEDSELSEDDINMDGLYCYGWGFGLTECHECDVREYIGMMINWLEYRG